MVKITDTHGILLFLSVLYSSEYVCFPMYFLSALECKAWGPENGENANYFGII